MSETVVISLFCSLYFFQQMRQAIAENKQLRSLAESYFEQLQILRQKRAEHSKQIQTLLKFNDKLMHIIEKQVGSQRVKPSDLMTLHPISESAELESYSDQQQISNNWHKTDSMRSRNAIPQTHSHNVTNQLLTKGGSELQDNHQRRQYSDLKRSDSLNDTPVLPSDDNSPILRLKNRMIFKKLSESQQAQESAKTQQIRLLLDELGKSVVYAGQSMNLKDLANNIRSEIESFEEQKQRNQEFYMSKMGTLRKMQRDLAQTKAKNQISDLIDRLQGSNSRPQQKQAKVVLQNYLQMIKQ